MSRARACSSRATRRPASTGCTATSVQRAGRGRRGRHARDRRPLSVLTRETAQGRGRARALRRRARTSPGRPGRYRVHDRGRPAVDAAGAGRQEVAAGGVAHGDRDGRGRLGFPLSREQAVRRVLPLLADPPRVFRPFRRRPGPIASGLPASPGVASGSMVLTPDAAETVASSGQAGDPRPRRNVARGRARHGQGRLAC